MRDGFAAKAAPTTESHAYNSMRAKFSIYQFKRL
jgi:hypothetical protein